MPPRASSPWSSRSSPDSRWPRSAAPQLRRRPGQVADDGAQDRRCPPDRRPALGPIPAARRRWGDPADAARGRRRLAGAGRLRVVNARRYEPDAGPGHASRRCRRHALRSAGCSRRRDGRHRAGRRACARPTLRTIVAPDINAFWARSSARCTAPRTRRLSRSAATRRASTRSRVVTTTNAAIPDNAFYCPSDNYIAYDRTYMAREAQQAGRRRPCSSWRTSGGTSFRTVSR